jgi:hypothetical protein
MPGSKTADDLKEDGNRKIFLVLKGTLSMSTNSMKASALHKHRLR